MQRLHNVQVVKTVMAQSAWLNASQDRQPRTKCTTVACCTASEWWWYGGKGDAGRGAGRRAL